MQISLPSISTLLSTLFQAGTILVIVSTFSWGIIKPKAQSFIVDTVSERLNKLEGLSAEQTIKIDQILKAQEEEKRKKKQDDGKLDAIIKLIQDQEEGNRTNEPDNN